MRNLLIAFATSSTLLVAGLALPTIAAAMPLAPIAAPHLVDNVDFCPEVWGCSRFACGWTFACRWRREAYSYGPDVYVRPYRGWRRWRYRHDR